MVVFYKMHNRVCPEYLFQCLPPLTSDVSNYNLRNNDNYMLPRCRLTTSANSFILSSVRIWNNLCTSFRNSPTISVFKKRMKGSCFKAPKYYGKGPRTLSILHTRLRHQCSSLNEDLSKINVINNTKCRCGYPYEDSFHFFFECPLYRNERTNLFSGIDENDKHILKCSYLETTIKLTRRIHYYLLECGY